jgi:hypothetical protein
MDGLTRELEARYGSAQQILGDGHPLTQFIRNALESGDPKLLQVAKAACDGGHGMLHPWTNLPEPPREELVEEYARKPVRCFLQVDGWEDKNGGGSAMRPDEEGHVLTSGTRYELRNTDFPMRVQIYEASDKETVLALLGKAQTWLERGWEGLTTPPPPQAPDKQRSEEERTPIRAAERRVQEVRDEPQPAAPPPPPPPPPPLEAVGPTGRGTQPPKKPVGELSFPSGDGQEQAQALLERVFVLSADMSRLDPEGVAQIAADRPKYIEAYIEVADQGIEWYTRFRNALASAK